LEAEGLRANDNDDVAIWERRVCQPLVRGGACLIILDHVVKASDQRGRFAIGAQRKLALVTGAAYRVAPQEAFAVDKPGWFLLVCSKEREGHFLAGETAALVTVTGSRSRIEIDIQQGSGARVERGKAAARDRLPKLEAESCASTSSTATTIGTRSRRGSAAIRAPFAMSSTV
jgi:hypothetical protein